MAGYWKIEKEWVQDWGLSGNEAVLLAEMRANPGLVMDRYAVALGIETKSAYRIRERLIEKCPENVKKTIFELSKRQKNNCQKDNKKIVKKTTENCLFGCQKDNPPNNPLLKENKSLTNVSETRAREEENSAKKREQELALGGTIYEIKNLAEECKEETRGGGSFAASAIRLYGKFGLTTERLLAYLDEFVDKLTLDGKTLTSRRDFRNHFSSWLRIQVTTNNTKQNRYNNGTTRQQGTLGTGAVTRPANDRIVPDF